MTTTIAATQSTVRYHPIRGAVYGLLFGLGLALVLMVFKVLALSVPILIALGLLFLVLGALWGRFAPARAPKNPPPARATTVGTPRTTTLETSPSPLESPQPPAAPTA